MPKENLVLGVHDFIPPQGLVTVRLVDPDRKWRVRKEVKVENVVMNWWLSAANPVMRRLQWDDTTIGRVCGYAPNWSSTESGFTRDTIWSTVNGARQGYWPGLYGNYMRHVWASDVDATPDADKPWIPSDASLANEGNVTAMCSVDTVDTLSADHTQRGSWLPGDSYHDNTRSRTVMEWGTTQGNGTWRSIGLGNVNSRRIGNQAVPQGWLGYNRAQSLRSVNALNPEDSTYSYVNNVTSGGESIAYASETLLVAARSNSIIIFNPQAYTTVQVYTAFSTGSGKVTVAHDGTDLWVARGTSIYRVSDSDSNSITNTYDLSASITESDIYDITSDKTDLYVLTSTHVHQINSSGVWQSSWAHGLTASGYCENIEWDPNMDFLWISMDNDGAWTSGTYTEYWGDWAYSGDQSWEADDFRIRAFNKTGTQQPYWQKPGWNLGTDPYQLTMGFSGMDPQGWLGAISRSYYNTPTTSGKAMILGPSAASHVNLGTDFVKTSSDSLQLIYDFNYS